jgi:nitrite reductase/ring-hydroxylating ferredoxin subunit
MMPVSLSGGVEPGARTGTSVGGQPVVVWRGADGLARAWADLCPHRGMRLSFGFVRESQLTCIYHGWSFGDAPGGGGAGATGPRVLAARCLSVPAHPGMTPPGKAVVAVLPVAEALGMIWVGAGPGDTSLPHDALPKTSASGAAEAGDALHAVRSVTVSAPSTALRAALETTLPPGTEIVAGDGDLIAFKGPDLRVIAAVQDRGDGAASAHIVTTNPDTFVRKALCLWAALVRDHLAAVAVP